MTGLLDTSVFVGVEQRRLSAEVLPDQAAVCVLTLEELWLGVLRCEPALGAQRRATYEFAAEGFVALAIDDGVARASAEIRAEGRARGRRYRPVDSLIGATARVHALPLYTQDEGMLGMAGVDVRVV